MNYKKSDAQTGISSTRNQDKSFKFLLLALSTLVTILIVGFIVYFLNTLTQQKYIVDNSISSSEHTSAVNKWKEAADQYPDIEPVDVVTRKFGFPYPITWKEPNFTLSVTEIWIGRVLTSASMYDWKTGDFLTLTPGTEVSSIVLKLRIDVGDNAKCVNSSIRMLGLEGERIPPNIRNLQMLGSNCLGQNNTTYSGIDVPFIIQDNQREFHFATESEQETFRVTLNDRDEIEAALSVDPEN